ncbi:DnaJ family protein [Pseudohyphozyma bogoriensis]|nr:DnaJ family protein [Pseudohyphozyma bogoriensis]
MAQPGAVMEDIDYYAVLDVPSTATQAEIQRAYRMRSLKVHPDRNPDNPQAAQLFHELRVAFDLLADPTQRASFDALLAARNARKLRFQGLDNKRKAMAEDLDRREREYKKAKGEQDKQARDEKNELERLKEAGRKMREEREKAAMDVLKRDEEVDRIKEEERKKRKQEQERGGVVELGELDMTVRIKWVRAKRSDVVDADGVRRMLRELAGAGAEQDVDSVVLSSKFLANPTKGKHGSGLVVFKTLSAAVRLVDKARGWDGVEVTWASGSPPAVLGQSTAPEVEPEKSQPAFASSFPASMLVNDDEATTLAKMRERERLIEELKRQEEEEA